MKNIALAVILFIFCISCQNSVADAVKDVNPKSEQITNEPNDVTLSKAPDFSLPNINGQYKSLEDYTGQLIYMDIWATWCGPCLKQFPALKALKEKYKNSGIVFLSISVDPDSKKSKWLKMVKEEKLKGEQLFAGKQSGFGEAYRVEFIPRFLLISQNGEILMDQAPLPMDHRTGGINPVLEDIFQIYIKTNQNN